MNRFYIKSTSVIAVLTFVFIGCKSKQIQLTSKNQPGIQLEFMDFNTMPSEDFFTYVNGTWVKNTEIPSDRTRWGSFDELRKNTDDDVMSILNEAVENKNLTLNSDESKAVNLYKAILDTISRNRLGITPLMPYLKKIDQTQKIDDIMSLMIELKNEVNLGFFGAYVGADAKNSNKNVVYVGAGSLGLPDRDYYLSDKADNKEKEKNTFCISLKCFN